MQYSIVNLKSIYTESSIFRLDAEFFHPCILIAKRKIRGKNNATLRKLGAKIIHPIEIKREYSQQGIQILLAQNIRDNYFDFSTEVFMPYEVEASLSKNRLKDGDIVLTRSGANYGQCTVYAGSPLNIFACADDLVVRNHSISSKYLSTFLNTSLGKQLIESCKYGGSQPHIAPQTLYDIPIYIPSSANFIRLIDDCLNNSVSYSQRSELIYQQAQVILLSELGLADWQPRHQLTFIKNYSDTKQVGRIDADYYQPKYQKIIKTIQRYAGGWTTLGDLAMVKKCVEVGSNEYLEEGIPFIRVSNLSPFEITEEKYVSEKLYQEISQHQPKKGEILFSKDATPGIAYYLNETPQKMIPSGGILRLKNKSDKVNNEYLMLVLNSILTKEQVKRDVGGSVILHWRPEQVKQTLVPILPETKQIQIQQKVIKSFRLRQQSKYLLDCTKRAVEMAIEKGENKATKWLEKQIEVIN